MTIPTTPIPPQASPVSPYAPMRGDSRRDYAAELAAFLGHPLVSWRAYIADPTRDALLADLCRALPLTGAGDGWTLDQLRAWHPGAIDAAADGIVLLRIEDGALYANG